MAKVRVIPSTINPVTLSPLGQLIEEKLQLMLVFRQMMKSKQQAMKRK
jgi:hypothetical protein